MGKIVLEKFLSTQRSLLSKSEKLELLLNKMKSIDLENRIRPRMPASKKLIKILNCPTDQFYRIEKYQEFQ